MGATQYIDAIGPTPGQTLATVPCTVENIFAINPSLTDTIYFQIFDAVLAPILNDSPTYWFPLRPLETVNLGLPGPAGGSVAGRRFLNGLNIWFSTTSNKYTPGPQAAFWAVFRFTP